MSTDAAPQRADERPADDVAPDTPDAAEPAAVEPEPTDAETTALDMEPVESEPGGEPSTDADTSALSDLHRTFADDANTPIFAEVCTHLRDLVPGVRAELQGE